MCQSILTDNAKVEQEPSTRSLDGNIAKLVSSKVAAQVIAFIAAPLIARLFAPASFGTRQIFLSIAGIISVITCLRYELSIPVAKNREEAVAGFALSLFFTFIFTFAILALVPVLRGKISQWFRSPELRTFIWLLPIAVFLGGLGNSLKYWASREGRFGAIAWSDLSHTLIGTLVIIAWGFAIGSSAAGLFAGYLTSIFLGILVLSLFLSRKLVSDIKDANLRFDMLCTMAKQYRKFPIFSTWSGLLNSVSVQLLPIILGLCFSTTVVGYYSLGYRIIGFPMGLLGHSFAQVFFPTAAEEYNQTGTLSKTVSNVFKRLTQIGVFPIVALGLLGAPLFGLIFGEEWIEAGVYAQILSVWVLLILITSPLSTTFSILERQGTGLAFNIGLISSRASALLLGAQIGGPRVTLGAFAVVSTIGWSFMLYWILRNSGVSIWWALKTFLRYVGLSSLLLLPAVFSAWAWKSRATALAILVFATIIYIYGLYRLEPGFRGTAVNIITKRLAFWRWSKREGSL